MNDLNYDSLTLNYSILNSNINSNLTRQMKQSKVRKSTSLALFKTLPVENIVFNPKEFHVGESKITHLPERIITRRNSQPTLPKTQKPFMNKEPRSPKQTEISILKKINQNLSKQNAQLKKQLELYKKISRNNSSKKNSYLDQFSRRDLNKKCIAVQKINITKCSSRLASDNQTGLYSSKQMSCNIQFESINQMYQNFIKKSIKPTFFQFNQQLKKFFFDIEQTFIKLKYLFESVNKQQKINNGGDYAKCQNLMESIGDICQLKIQKEKASKYPGLVEKSKSRCKVERGPIKDKPQQKEDILQLMSPQEVVHRFEKYIQKMLRSKQTLRSLKQSLAMRELTRRLSEA